MADDKGWDLAAVTKRTDRLAFAMIDLMEGLNGALRTVRRIRRTDRQRFDKALRKNSGKSVIGLLEDIGNDVQRVGMNVAGLLQARIRRRGNR